MCVPLVESCGNLQLVHFPSLPSGPLESFLGPLHLTYWKLQGQIQDSVSAGLTVCSSLLSFQPEFSLCFFSFCTFLYWWGLHYFICIHYFFKVCLTLIYLLQKMNLVWTEFWWCSCGWVGKKMRHDPSLTFLKRLQYSERLGDLKNVKQLSSPLSGTAEFLDLF